MLSAPLFTINTEKLLLTNPMEFAIVSNCRIMRKKGFVQWLKYSQIPLFNYVFCDLFQ